MLASGVDESMPTAVTVTVVLPVCAKLRVVRAGRSIHGYVIKTGLEFDTVWKCFGIDMISKKCLPNYSTLANVLPFCSLVEYGRHYGKEIYDFVVQHSLEMYISVSNALMAHYSKVCEMRAVESIFRSSKVGDIVTWNTVIAGYVMYRYPSRALELFQGLLFTGMAPDSVSLISLLTACA
uniref:Pentatricopeptide repeat-containing protein n=1 Tax=Oryza punctata TaxID=4537 RepID=A0A0E0JYM4_ORYPU